ncbi:HlyD family efflux transporter periplasmic adaptor subunit [Massilia sp. W12]|uniref:HlyD family secretion protein n=1 Tax=Massilia sp. W12 TaxID=3126507 RepID=UPI0030D37356
MPVPTRILAAGGLLIGACLLALLFFGSYTRRSTVSGQLLPDAGLIRVYAPQSGVALNVMARPGEQVAQGAPLIELSNEQHLPLIGNSLAEQSAQIAARRHSLEIEIQQTSRLQREQILALQQKIAGLQSEVRSLQMQIDNQQSRVKLAQDAMLRARQLASQQFIALEQLQTREAESLEQSNLLQGQLREKLKLENQIKEAQANLAESPLLHEKQLAQLKRAQAAAAEEYSVSEARRGLILRAPQAGVVSAVALERGQSADPARPLMHIVPNNARLQAELYVSNRAIGFIRVGSPVLLRYQAFPYQKFGHAKGRVSSVSRVALPPHEVQGAINAGNDSLHKVVVKLESQTVRAYGRDEALQSGMQLEADILQERRRLYEWVLDPLLSVSGKL